MSKAAFNSFQEAADFVVAGWYLDVDELVVFLEGGVGEAVGAVVDEVCNVLSKTVAGLTELTVGSVDLIGVVAVCTLAGVHLEVVGGPALGGVDGA